MASIILGGGCFWCLEAVYQRVKGVEKVISGYCGGHVDNPSYRAVCDGTTGHTEVVEVQYDASVIQLEELLDIFFIVHDPTTLNRQGNDVGTQYRSAVYYQTETQKSVVEKVIAAKQNDFSMPIVTEVTPLETFWPAEEYHQDYYNQNTSQPYCQMVVGSKVQKLKSYFADYVVND